MKKTVEDWINLAAKLNRSAPPPAVNEDGGKTGDYRNTAKVVFLPKNDILAACAVSILAMILVTIIVSDKSDARIKKLASLALTGTICLSIYLAFRKKELPAAPVEANELKALTPKQKTLIGATPPIVGPTSEAALPAKSATTPVNVSNVSVSSGLNLLYTPPPSKGKQQGNISSSSAKAGGGISSASALFLNQSLTMNSDSKSIKMFETPSFVGGFQATPGGGNNENNKDNSLLYSSSSVVVGGGGINNTAYTTPLAAGMNSASFVTSPPPAVRILPGSASSSAPAVSTLLVSDEEKASTLLSTLSFENAKAVDCLDEWILNLQKSLINHIRFSILQPMETNNKKLAEMKDMSGIQIFSDAILNYEGESNLLEFEMASQRALQIASSIYGQNVVIQLNELVREKKKLDRYLSVSRKTSVDGDPIIFSKAYVLKRLKKWTSSTSYDLVDYYWSRNIFEEEKQQQENPTDAEIAFRVICLWFESVLKRDSISETREKNDFQHLHVRNCYSHSVLKDFFDFWGFIDCGHRRVKKNNSKNVFYLNLPDVGGNENIYQPHYKVAMNGSIYEIKAGRLNVFHAAIVFVLLLSKNNVMGLQSLVSSIFKKF